MTQFSTLMATFGMALLLWPSTLTNAHPLMRRVENIDIQVTSNDNFCSYLPPSPGESIAQGEGNAVPFCTQQQESGTRTFPEGFIVSSHFEQKDTYVQVTGRIDPSKYGLSESDGGGQYDNKNEHGGTCNGYKYWVNLVEPAQKTFCIRCCQNKDECNTGISEKGCEAIVKDADYS